MADAELGQKQTCTECSARFYDFNRTPAVCPACETVQPEQVSRLKRKTEEQLLPKEKTFQEKDSEVDSDDEDLLADDLDEGDLDDDLDDDDDDDDISQDIDVSRPKTEDSEE